MTCSVFLASYSETATYCKWPWIFSEYFWLLLGKIVTCSLFLTFYIRARNILHLTYFDIECQLQYFSDVSNYFWGTYCNWLSVSWNILQVAASDSQLQYFACAYEQQFHGKTTSTKFLLQCKDREWFHEIFLMFTQT